VIEEPAGGMRPSPARMYDYFLGGHHNFPIDRKAAEEVIAAFPDMPVVAQANRAFLRRAVRFLVDEGISQFLDIGSGIPTVGNVHDVAQAINPSARVVYVDVDPVAVTHGRALLASNPNAMVIQADARDVDRLITEAGSLLDLAQPVGVLLVALLHFIPDDETARRVVVQFNDAMPPGSYVVVSHALSEPTVVLTPEGLDAAQGVYQRATAPFTARTRERIERLVEPLDLVEPGLALLPLWRPEGPDDVLLDEPKRAAALAAVGRNR
jgi:hypothetical protein